MNKIGAIVFIAFLTTKLFTDKGEIAIVRVDQTVAHKCYNASLEAIKKKKEEKEEI